MVNFKDLEIKVEAKGFEGNKIEMYSLIGNPIIVHYFQIRDSKFPEKGNGKCLCMQIEFENVKRVVFTTGVFLQEVLHKIPKDGFPFSTIIVKENKAYKFT